MSHPSPCVIVAQLLSRVRVFVTPWTAAHQVSLSPTVFQSLLKFMSIESVMLSNHLILCRHLLLLPSVSPSVSLFHCGNSLHEVAKVLKASALASVLPLNIQG